jgi:hypothetical protein
VHKEQRRNSINSERIELREKLQPVSEFLVDPKAKRSHLEESKKQAQAAQQIAK